jgi:hypothetical protein
MDPGSMDRSRTDLIALAVALIAISLPTSQRWLAWPALASFVAAIVVGNVGRWGPADFFRNASQVEDVLTSSR